MRGLGWIRKKEVVKRTFLNTHPVVGTDPVTKFEEIL